MSKIEELKAAAQSALAAGMTGTTIVIPRRWRAPKGFPRRELLCEGIEGRVYRVDAAKLLKFLDGIEGAA